MMSDYKDAMRVSFFDLFHDITYSRKLEASFLHCSCTLDNIQIKMTLELNKMQFRKVYAILLASLLHRDPNDSIVTL
jgi:hypothetical protein